MLCGKSKGVGITMKKEAEFYEGVSRCVRVSKGDHKAINLTLHKIFRCVPSQILFCGRVIDGCSENPLNCVCVTIDDGVDCQSEYTDEKGCFNFKLPCFVETVKIRLCKRGFRKRYIDEYYINRNCDNCFCMYEKNI